MDEEPRYFNEPDLTCLERLLDRSDSMRGKITCNIACDHNKEGVCKYLTSTTEEDKHNSEGKDCIGLINLDKVEIDDFSNMEYRIKSLSYSIEDAERRLGSHIVDLVAEQLEDLPADVHPTTKYIFLDDYMIDQTKKIERWSKRLSKLLGC